MTSKPKLLPAGRRFGFALSLTSVSFVLWEILLTRIYSVTLYYHYAFMAVSVALFGLTAGAVLVQLIDPPMISDEDVSEHLAYLSLATGILMAACISIQLAIPAIGQNLTVASSSSPHMIITYLLSSIPFVPAGAFTCLALTRFRGVGTLYAYDLLGAGVACAAFPLVISWLGGPGAVVFAGAAACLAAFVLLVPYRDKIAYAGLGLAIGLLGFCIANRDGQWLRVRWRPSWQAQVRQKSDFERWNAISRITVDPWAKEWLPGWGIDPENAPLIPAVDLKLLAIDTGAATPLTRFDGVLKHVEYLRYDLTAFAYHMVPPGGDVFIIGAGGGRDVLAALASGHSRIVGVEVNPDIVRAVNETFGDFTGHLDRIPQVQMVIDEGRSRLSRTPGRFDIIQVSLVDTIAATAAGAFAFTENGIYTVEAWKLFIRKLKPRGVLTFSRWYYGSTVWPVEIYRVMALAATALRSLGVADPARHILLVRGRRTAEPGPGMINDGVATLLVSPDPFSGEDLERARKTCVELYCDIAFSWRESKDPQFAAILTGSPSELYRRFSLDVTPPTDDRPYFFFHAKLENVIRGVADRVYGGSSPNLIAVQILVQLTYITLGIGLCLIVVPPLWLAWRGRWTSSRRGFYSSGIVLYFAAIGLAFMFIEISIMQRLSLFLGNPTYGFTVVLFTLFLFSGLGSLTSDSMGGHGLLRSRRWRALALLIPLLTAMDCASLFALEHAVGAATPIRIVVVMAILGVPAFLMGFAFPLGMGLVHRERDTRAAWYWAINGAFSVIASVLAMVSCFGLGIRGTLWIGIAFYAATALLFRSLDESKPGTDVTAGR